MTDHETAPADSAYHRRLPIGERLSTRPLIDDDPLSCFDEVTLAFWDAVLPSMPEEMKAEHLRIVAESLATGGGTAFPGR